MKKEKLIMASLFALLLDLLGIVAIQVFINNDSLWGIVISSAALLVIFLISIVPLIINNLETRNWYDQLLDHMGTAYFSYRSEYELDFYK